MGKSVNPLEWVGLGVNTASDIYKASREEKMYYDNLNWQKEQYYDSQNFSREQADTQWQREKEMFNMENEYNSAASQVQRYKDAGLNPQVMMSGNAASVASGGAASVGQSVAPPQLQMDNLPTGAAGAIGSALSGSADLLKSMADAKKAGIDVNLLEQTFDDAIQQMHVKTSTDYLNNQIAAFTSNMNMKYGDKIKEKELEEITARVDNLITTGNVLEAQRYLTETMSSKYGIENEFNRKRLDRADEYIDGEIASIFSSINLNNAKAGESRSAAQLNYAKVLVSQAEVDELRSRAGYNRAQTISVQEFTKLTQAQKYDLVSKNMLLYEDEHGKLKINKDIRKRYINATIRMLENQATLVGSQIRYTDANTDLTKANTSLAKEQYYLNIYDAFLNTVNTGANAYSKIAGPAISAAGYSIW